MLISYLCLAFVIIILTNLQSVL